MSERELTEGQLLSQDFGVGGPPAAKNVVPVRPLAVIEAELDMLQRDTRQKEEALLCNCRAANCRKRKQRNKKEEERG